MPFIFGTQFVIAWCVFCVSVAQLG